MKLLSNIPAALLAMVFSTGVLADPVPLPCEPHCTPIPPCTMDPHKPGCPGQGGPIPSTTTQAPNPPDKDKVAPTVPPPPEPTPPPK